MLTLGVGTATNAPFKFTTPGTVLKTTPVTGEVEPDTNGLVYGTSTSGRGMYDQMQTMITNTNYTLTSQTAAQKIFNTSTNGAFTAQASTTYKFEVFYYVTGMSATSGTFGFTIGGTATITSVNYTSRAQKAASVSGATTISETMNNVVANPTLIAANIGTAGWVRVEGHIRTNGAGTLIPQITLGIASAAVIQPNSYFRITPIGSNTNTVIGSVFN